MRSLVSRFLWTLEKYNLDDEMFEEHMNVYPWEWICWRTAQQEAEIDAAHMVHNEKVD